LAKTVDIVSLGEAMVEFYSSDGVSLGRAKNFEKSVGGDTVNLLYAASRFGKKCGYITRVGSDEFGKYLIDAWKREGIDVSNVVVEDGGFTGIYFISLLERGERDFTYYRRDSAASHLSPGDVNPEYLSRCRVFHSSGISQAISASCREAVFKAAEAAKKSGAMFSYDPNVRLKLWSVETAREVIDYTLEMADIVVPSFEDMKLITGLSSPDDVAKAILKKGAKVVALKLGSEGSLVVTEKERIKTPGFKVDAVDTTGAGDVFNGVFLVGFLEDWGLEKTAKFSNAAAALKTLGRGAVSLVPAREEVSQFLKNKKSDEKSLNY